MLRLSSLFLLGAALLAAQAPTGAIAGSVLDSQTGRPVPGVTVLLNGQQAGNQKAGTDGRFTLTVSPGSYTLTFQADNYSETKIEQVVVKAGEVTEASTVMANKSVVTTVEVNEKASAVGATAEAMLTERKLAASVSDSIGKEELSNSASSNAAGALEKVIGVSVVGDGFVYVRGLGERYSATMMNGAMLPTTEPEKRVVSLDLFPSGLIDNIKILKTYTPDLPAEFAGGLVQMQTIEFPTQKMFQVNTKAGFNTRTSFNPFQTYAGGGASDFFGFGGGSRGVPAQIPADQRLFPGAFTPAQFQSFGQSFPNIWQSTTNASQRPASDFSAVGGGTFKRVGIVGAISFSNSPQTLNEYQRYFRQGGDGPITFTEYKDFNDYTETARLGAVFNVALRLADNHKLVFRNTLTHEADKGARRFSGYDGGVDGVISSERLHYVERNLFSTSVEGEHAVPSWHGSVFKWQLTYSNSSRNEPDLREVIRGQLPDGRFTFSALGSSGIRFFSDLKDHIYEPQADHTIPFFKGKISGIVKTGFRATIRHRDFQARRFRFIPQQATTLDLFLPSDQLFAPSNIRPNGFQIVEFTRGTDRYSADMDIYAGYSMVDMALGAKWRVVGGVRFEKANLHVVTIDNLVPNARPATADLRNTDPTPGVNLIYQLTPRQNLRWSYSRTVSRPDFRELSPFDFNNVLGGFVVQGNPDLKRAIVNNYDARWESFLGGNQIIAVSFFVKKFTNPIEQTILPSNDLRQTFVNAAGARNLGLEFEFRKNLGSIYKRLREFSFTSNLTFVDSNIDIKPENAGVVTSQSRPLLGQSRYIFNAIGEWRRPAWHSQARFYSNYVSRRISGVGTFGLPDIYQEGNTFLDFVYQYTFSENGKWALRFDAENLADNKYRWTQADLIQRQYQTGRTFQVGVSYSFF
ncbi:MAG TPA: TonB-dependent receptor [Bryobacteraceae bacterium]|nr:TonB-dependent receptor [Bryobacteraceae bacterium]